MSNYAAWDGPFPKISADELGRGWGDELRESQRAESGADPDADLGDEERLLREVPPHHGD